MIRKVTITIPSETWLTASQAGTNWSYGINNLNQYTQLTTNLSSTPTYDADGNVLSRSSHHPTQPLNWNYEWNSENRLIRVTNIRDTEVAMNYDYLGRRIEKKVYTYAGGLIGFLQLQSHRRYVYDGYKLVEELDALNSNAVIRRYTWQPDAAGLDVPLSVYDATLDKIYYYHTDANKNVTELTDAEGNIVAHYEYSPFGQITKQSGAYAEANPFRFSSEYYDAEIKLIYYNYRHYDPELGRWLNRDPIAEEGGWNLFASVKNNPVNYWDDLGLNIFKRFWRWLFPKPKPPPVTPEEIFKKIDEGLDRFDEVKDSADDIKRAQQAQDILCEEDPDKRKVKQGEAMYEGLGIPGETPVNPGTGMDAVNETLGTYRGKVKKEKEDKKRKEQEEANELSRYLQKDI